MPAQPVLDAGALAEAGGRSWQITRHGIWPPVIQAADVAGEVVGEFSGRGLHHGTALRWSHRELTLRIDRLQQDRYILVDGDRKLATIDGAGSDKRPLNVAIDDTADIDPGLLLFAIYVVRTLAREANAIELEPASFCASHTSTHYVHPYNWPRSDKAISTYAALCRLAHEQL
jgi:hypothetical protein